MKAGLTVKRARNGKGLFAIKLCKASEILYEVHGRRFHYTTLLSKGGTFLDNCFRLSESYYLSPEGHIGVFQNHSCKPNARVEKRGGKLFVIALSPIQPGREVLIDYSTITASDDTWAMPCNCGEPACRTTIRAWTKLPKLIQDYYIQERILPLYIQNL